MSDPITPEDLYGPSNPPTPEGASSIPIEETPEITTESQPAHVSAVPAPIAMPQPAPTSPPPTLYSRTKSSSFGTTLGAIIMFIGLFGLGIWLSSFLRQYFPNGLNGLTPQKQVAVREPTLKPTPADLLAAWKTFQVLSATTKQPIEGLSFKLPPDVLSPACDTTTCMSQGTYLPGGTRFTVAPRGIGQLLIDYRGSVISDVSGTVFTANDITVIGHKAKIFTGTFVGRTVAGYGFSQMRGYMIEVTPTLSLEINHFTPTGVTADFAADDALFDQIVSTLVLPESPSPTPIVTTAVSTTSSGY